MSQPCPRLGLIVSLSPNESATKSDADAMRADLIVMLESNGLSLLGPAIGVPEQRVVREGGQATDADRRLVMDWASRWARVATIGVSAPVDLGDDS